jgi:hypothetical protein
MYLLLITLNKEEYLDDVLSCLVELGIQDATIVETQSMENALAYKIPIFAGLRFQLGGGKPYSKTILAVTDNKNVGKEIISMLKEIDINFEEEGTGRIITIKIESVLGSVPEIEEI